MSKINLNDYVCMVPFNTLEVHHNHQSDWLCCPSWLPKPLPITSDPTESWNSNEANDIRKSVTDGSFKYCDQKQCPFLKQLINYGEIGNTKVFKRKTELIGGMKERVDKFLSTGSPEPPQLINFSFDRTCNLKCPSCRKSIIVEDSSGIKRVKDQIDVIEKEYGNDIKTLYITGTGDPFVSVGFRDFLRNFDESRWTNLERIHLHTNATRWTSEMWSSMPNIHKYVKSCEISIDAGTKETYENKTRIGGDWDELIENLKFISTIKTITSIKTSFVVQKHNYKEIKIFHDLVKDIFGQRVNVFFGKINNWGTFTNDEYIDHKVWDTNHPEYNDFLNEVRKLLPSENTYHNLQEFLSDDKPLI